MRKFRRLPRERSFRHTLRVPCQVVRERDFRLIADRVEDVSLGGLLVSPAEPVLTGEPVIISFRWPLGGWLDAEARVVRIDHGRRPGEVRRALGIQFDHIEKKQQWLLQSYLGWLPPAPPRFRPGRRDFGRSLSLLLA